MKNKEERKRRVIARGEHSNHSHVITGDVEFINKDGVELILVGENSNAVLKHILENEYLESGEEIWTGEHEDIKLDPGTYKFIQQQVFDPISKRIENAKD